MKKGLRYLIVGFIFVLMSNLFACQHNATDKNNTVNTSPTWNSAIWNTTLWQ